MPAANNMESQEAVENSGSSPGAPSFNRPYLLTASQTANISNAVVTPTKNQSNARNTVPVIALAVWAKRSDLKIPTKATRMQIAAAMMKIIHPLL